MQPEHERGGPLEAERLGREADDELSRLLEAERRAGAAEARGWLQVEPPAVDLATLLGEMAALKSEVRAETVAAREQRETLQQAVRLLEGELGQARRRETEQAEALADLQRRHERKLAGALIELWDRLEPASRHAAGLGERLSEEQEPPPRWMFWKRRSPRRPEGARAATALAEGLELTIRRLAEQLAALGVERIEAQGQPFDPHDMEAVEVVERLDVPEGSVVDVLLPGYRDGAGLIRTAQVVVSRRGGLPAGKSQPQLTQ